MKYIIRGISILLIIGFLIIGSKAHNEAATWRGTIRSQSAIGDSENSPEIVLLTHVLGGFKGLLVDAVWLRAVKLQQEERFWELYQLYNWIGKLEPHLDGVWKFNAWNMSYNIVAELKSSEERWRWIERALDYLRLEGLKHNPKSSPIMAQLAWIYHHKIGKQTDLHHFYYKHRLALKMAQLLGPKEFQDMGNLYSAPDTVDELMEDEDIKLAVLRINNKYPGQARPLLERAAQAPTFMSIPTEIREVLFDRYTAEKAETMTIRQYLQSDNGVGMQKVINFVIKRILKKDLGIRDFEVLKEIDAEFGRFDWRLPEIYALYWGVVAQKTDPARFHGNPKERLKKQIDYDRMILFSIKQTMARGILMGMRQTPTNENAMSLTEDLSKIEPLHKLYVTLIYGKYKDRWNSDIPGAESVRDGHYDFLKHAVRRLYFAGDMAKANEYFMFMKQVYGKPSMDTPIKEYQLGQLKKLIDEWGNLNDSMGVVMGMIDTAYRHLERNQMKMAKAMENESKEAWRAYREYNLANKEDRLKNADNLATWDTLRNRVLLLIDTGRRSWPENRINNLFRIMGIKRLKKNDPNAPNKAFQPAIIPPAGP
jgi:hypothetical protein